MGLLVMPVGLLGLFLKGLTTELCLARQQRQEGVVLIIFIVVVHLTTILGALSKKEEPLKGKVGF